MTTDVHSAAPDARKPAAPWHLWAVGLVGLLWNGFGAYDYTMSQLRGDAYLASSGMTADQIAYFHAMPAWMTGAWAIGVWGALAATVLLLMRSRYAAPTFALSLLGLLATLAYTHLLSDGARVMGQQGLIMNIVILAADVGFLAYAQWMAKRGVLR